MSRQLVFTLVGAVIATAVATQSTVAQPIDVQRQNIVALYRFDDGSGTSAVDSATLDGIQTANQNQGTIGWTTGLIGGALDLDGSSSLQAPDALTSQATEFTISAWVNMDNNPGYDGIYSARDTENWGLNVEGGSAANLHFDFRYDNDPGGGSQGVDSANGSAVVGTWHHIAMTWTALEPSQGGFRDIYVDGVMVGSANDTVADIYTGHLSTWNIGDDPCCGGRELDAQLDELAVWNVALSSAEIAQIHTAGLAGNGLLEPVDNNVLGDADGNGVANAADFEIIRANFGRDGNTEGVILERIDGDLVNDNKIDFADYGQWKQAPKSGAGAGNLTIPEPSALLLMVISGLGVATTRRRK